MDLEHTKDGVRYRSRMVPRVSDPLAGSDEELGIYKHGHDQVSSASFSLQDSDEEDAGGNKSSRVRTNSHNASRGDKSSSLNGISIRSTVQEVETSFGGVEGETAEDTHRLISDSSDGDDDGMDLHGVVVFDDTPVFISHGRTDSSTPREKMEKEQEESSKDGGVNVNTLIQSIQSDESSLSIITQVSLPFIIAGYGTVGAGMVLDIVQHWTVFQKVGEIFILVPALLGLKGNLEMTLASRLSTQANLGNMDSRKEVMKMVGGNMALIQAQAIVVGFLSSLTAMIMGWIPKGEFDINHGLLLCASSLFTASIASMVLGSIMVMVVLMSRHFKINPDNVATPIAASLGDLVTLTLLAWVGNLLFEAIGKQHWLAPVIISFFLVLLPLWVVICVKNKYTNEVIYSGWTPVLSAMVISSFGGLILDFAVENYHGIAVFQPVINGVGGNLVAVHASRISTTLHQKGRPGGHIHDNKLKGCLNPFKVFFGSGVHSRAARVLTMLTLPGHLLFTYTIFYMKAGHTSMSFLFNLFYLTAALLQVVILIYIATWMVPMIWVGGSDPDNVAIPYLTAIGDLLGTGFLALAFHLLFLLGDRDADVGD